MKNHLNYAALVAILVGLALAGALVTSCRKDPLDLVNPKVDKLPEAGFSLEGTEKRSDGEYVLPWTISKAGGVDSVLEELDELTLTPYNTFTLEAVPDNENGFPGINARTDNSCIKLERLDQNRFAMAFLGDGEATVKVWNGNEAGNTTIEFKVKARGNIPVEGLLVLVDGNEEVLVKAVEADDWPELFAEAENNPFYEVKYVSDERVEHSFNMTVADYFKFYSSSELDPHKVEILHLVPENTTWRRTWQSTVSDGVFSSFFFKGKYNWVQNKTKEGSSNYLPDGTDISILYGKTIFIGSRPSRKKGNLGFGIPGDFRLTQRKETRNEIPASSARILATDVICNK